MLVATEKVGELSRLMEKVPEMIKNFETNIRSCLSFLEISQDLVGN